MSSPLHGDPNGPTSILLTGGTSFLGTSVIERLQTAGSRVTVVVRPSSPVERIVGLTAAPDIRVHDGTIGSLVEIVSDVMPDVVVHLATLYRRDHTVDDVDALVASNLGFGTQLLDAMRIAGCRRLVTAGTYFQHYDSEGYRPLSLYAATKQAFEDILAYYVDACDFRAITLVLYDVYGPGDPRSKLMEAVRKAQRSGEPLPLPDHDVEMDLVYIDDAVDAFERAVTLVLVDGSPGVERYAVSAGQRHTLSELLSTFEEVAGVPVPHEWGRFATPARSITTPWVGQSLPGWRPRWSLREGVERFLAAG